MPNLRKRWVYTSTLLLTLAFGTLFLYEYLQESALHEIPTGFRKFKLYDPLPACARWKEHMPPTRDPVAYKLYIEARNLWRSKIEWQLSREEATWILTNVKKAAELGDWGARALLAHLYLEGLGPLASNEVLKPDAFKSVEIARLAAEAMQPWGLYDLGVAYEHGYGGAHYDVDLAWAYYLKAAQLGSPEAQMTLAQAYGESGRRDAETIMLQCAYEQGYGRAAYELTLNAGVALKFQEGLLICQNGVKFGSLECARKLWIIFNQGYWSTGSVKEKEATEPLGIKVDAERERRYREIYDALEINPDLKFKKLDAALPLPPAKLPEWSGIQDAIEPESNAPPTY